MKIGFIGAGKVGFSLGRYFVERGISIEGYYSRNLLSAQKAASFTKSVCFINLDEIVRSCDIIFITTPDDVIEEVWNNIKDICIQGKIICHCSGSLTSRVFEGIEKYKAYGYSLHPLYAISSREESYKELDKAYLTLEGDEEKISQLEQIIRQLKNPYQVISNENKALYHVAAVTVSNQVIALIEQGVKNLQRCGFEQSNALNALWPLIRGNIEAVYNKGIEGALTGPIERNDIGTIRKHLSILQEEEQLLYALLSIKLLSIATKKNPNEDYTLARELLMEIAEKC